jgi:hypothetical protein
MHLVVEMLQLGCQILEVVVRHTLLAEMEQLSFDIAFHKPLCDKIS